MARIPEASESRAFTLVELVVVVAVVAVLATMVFPAVAYTSDKSRRAACRSNLRQLASVMTVYAADNADKVLPARQGTVQIALNLPVGGLDKLGLSAQTNAPSIWACPNIPGLPYYEAAFGEWIIGYQYFGGITNWQNVLGTFPSRSPVKLSQAQPYWTLAADCVIQVDGVWGGGGESRDSALYANLPQHHAADSLIPQGGNQAFCDGSVQWIPAQNMYALHSWNPASRRAFFYQDPKDFDPFLRTFLSSLPRP